MSLDTELTAEKVAIEFAGRDYRTLSRIRSNRITAEMQMHAMNQTLHSSAGSVSFATFAETVKSYIDITDAENRWRQPALQADGETQPQQDAWLQDRIHSISVSRGRLQEAAFQQAKAVDSWKTDPESAQQFATIIDALVASVSHERGLRRELGQDTAAELASRFDQTRLVATKVLIGASQTAMDAIGPNDPATSTKLAGAHGNLQKLVIELGEHSAPKPKAGQRASL